MAVTVLVLADELRRLAEEDDKEEPESVDTDWLCPAGFEGVVIGRKVASLITGRTKGSSLCLCGAAAIGIARLQSSGATPGPF